MTLDEQIKILESNAEFERKDGDLQGCLNFRQLAGWLKDYKRLLGAIEDIRTEISKQEVSYRKQNDRCGVGLDMALRIIYKHISEKETE